MSTFVSRLSTVPLMLLVIASTSRAQAAYPLTGAPSSAPVIHAGDVLRISVWRQPELSGDIPVSPDGTLSHPVYRAVSVGGAPLDVAEMRVQSFLKSYEAEPQVSFEALFSVTVNGEVQKPNVYLVPSTATLAQAIAMAGGPTKDAGLDRVRLLRGGREVQLDLTNSTNDVFKLPVQSGDQIWVDQHKSIFRDYLVPGSSIAAAAALVARVIVLGGKW